MDSQTRISIGFVPSLEAIPFVAELSGNGVYRMVPCPSYGRIIRQLLAGQLTAGLLPFEIFLIEILSRPALIERWCVPMVLPAAPVELVMRRRMMKQIQQAEQGDNSPAIKTVTIGVESRNSLTRHQFISWQQGQAPIQAAKPVFKMLPMELMKQAMLAGTIDGFVAPAPWGLAATSSAECSLVENFAPEKLAQELVLCCNRSLMSGRTKDWVLLPEKLDEHRQSCMTVGTARDKAIEQMKALGRPLCDEEALAKGFNMYGDKWSKKEMIPDLKWVTKQIDRTSRLVPSVSRSPILQETARSLVLGAEPGDLTEPTVLGSGLVAH
jgi:hypothetical protein